LSICNRYKDALLALADREKELLRTQQALDDEIKKGKDENE